jgi:bifunctional ADP-heptose synthase (sugar kinase/adenylyltransferase)
MEVSAALSTIIGQRGVAALFRRSLSISSAACPVLTELDEPTQTEHPYQALQQALAKLDAEQALAASSALAENFHHLLTTLIGPALTERLLRNVWPPSFSTSGHAVEDSTT